MKTSSATSATATAPPRPAGRSSGKPHSPTSAEFALTGPSNAPDSRTHAYRKDLADCALAGRVIASHYAEPVTRTVAKRTKLQSLPTEESEVVRELDAGELFAMLDDSVGWAWGYGGGDRLVGYVRSDALIAG